MLCCVVFSTPARLVVRALFLTLSLSFFGFVCFLTLALALVLSANSKSAESETFVAVAAAVVVVVAVARCLCTRFIALVLLFSPSFLLVTGRAHHYKYAYNNLLPAPKELKEKYKNQP